MIVIIVDKLELIIYHMKLFRIVLLRLSNLCETIDSKSKMFLFTCHVTHLVRMEFIHIYYWQLLLMIVALICEK